MPEPEPDPNAAVVKSLIHESESWPLFRIHHDWWICYQDDDEGTFYGWCETTIKMHSAEQAQHHIDDMTTKDIYRNIRLETAEVNWVEI